MKKTSLILAAVIALTGIAQAVQMSFTDNNWDTVTQTYLSGEIQPGVPSVIPITFAKFDTKSGTRSLQSVTVTITQQSWGGFYAVDNDGATTANITAQHGVAGSIAAVGMYLLPAGSTATLSQLVTSGGTRELAANDGDPTATYNEGTSDHYRLDGPVKANAYNSSASGTISDAFKSFYEGAGNLSMNYTATQSSFHTGEGALYYSGGPAFVDTVITVTYNYVPEPTSMALLAIGCAVLGLRRRNRAQKA